MELRAATSADESFAFDVMKAAFGPYVELYCGWDEAAQRALHERRFAKLDVRIIRDGAVDVGYVGVTREPDCLRVNQLFVHPDHQGRGLGGACMREIVEEAASDALPVRLRVLRVDPRALAFYRRLGFRQVELTDSHHLLERSA